MFYADNMKTNLELDPSGEVNDHTIHIAFPITAPKYTSLAADIPFSGADAVA